MKRHAALQALSREHHHALTLAKACERAAAGQDVSAIRAACQRVLQAMASELAPHFMREERDLLPLLAYPEAQMLLQRTFADHRRLHELLPALQQGQADALAEFGARLAQHVRFEERELFPALEQRLD
ncbi:MAG: hemerythrin domain-containing protein [Sideroxydans sp.]|nr:hemerythrin domain-containing protein [Sideroxydans sp.]